MSNDNLKRGVRALAPVNSHTTGDEKEKANPNSGEENKAKEDNFPMAKALVALAEGSCEFFHDERGDGYALVRENNFRYPVKLSGKPFRGWLTGTFYKTTKQVPGKEAVSSALSVLEAKAIHDGSKREMFNRFAMHEGAIYIDMADKRCRAIMVTAAGWEIIGQSPVMFRRYSHQQALPEPVGGGKLSDIHQHLAIKSKDGKRLLEAFLVACAFSDVPRPAITFHGPQGASKTTTARCLKAITDPSLLGSVDLGRSSADLAQILDHHGIPCFDNLTTIPAWAADMLCRAVTGGTFSKRALFTDDLDIILSFKRAIIITGINIPTHAPDLLDRLLLIELERIPPRKRLDETTFWSKFNEDRPKLFGALLDAIVGTMRHLETLKLTRMARMADFTRIACAFAEYDGFGSQKMLALIMRHTRLQTEEVLAADPVGGAVFEFIKVKEFWTGTPAKLLELLGKSAPTPRADGWPKQPNGLTTQMNKLHSTFSDLGVRITRPKGRKNGRLMTLEYKVKSSSPSSSAPTGPVHEDSAEDDKTKP